MSDAPSALRLHQRISFKLISAVVVTLVVVLGVSMSWVSWVVWSDFYRNAEQVSVSAAQRAQDVVHAYLNAAQQNARRDFGLLKQRYASGSFSVSPAAGPAGAAPTPILSWNGEALNGKLSDVDAFTKETGGTVATFFVREGDDFRRITTSVKQQDGQRAIGTLLDRNHPAYPLLMRSEAYAGPATLFGRPYMTVYEPLTANGQTIGIMFTGTDISELMERLQNGMKAIKVGETGRVYAVHTRAGAAQGQILGVDASAPPRVDLSSPAAKQWFETVSAAKDIQELHLNWSPLDATQASYARFVAVAPVSALGWALVAEASDQEMLKTARHALTFLWLGALIAMGVLTLVLLQVNARVVLRPIRRLSDALGKLATGDLTHTIPSTAKDEVGQLSEDMERFRLTLKDSLLTVRQSADTVSLSSREIAEGNHDLSHRTESQASALEETAASMEEMSATVQHNANNAIVASQLASAATTVAQRGGQTVSDVVDSMNAINQSSQKIADITGVIDGIAFQTNILALNAAVEAARAGEQGRGFAVVAGEVRTLAQRSAAAAKEIKGLITQSVDEVRVGAQQVDQARATMHEVVASIRKVSDTLSEISAASHQQSEGVRQVGEAVVELDQTTQQNAALVEEMAAAATSLNQQAQQLVEVVSRFHLGTADTLPGAHLLTDTRVSMSGPKRQLPGPNAPQRLPH